MYKNILIAALTLSSVGSVTGQNNKALYQKGLNLIAAWHFKAALPIFEGLLQKDSSNVNYLQYTAFLYAKVWHDKDTDISQSTVYYNKADYLARKALKLDSNSAEAHYAYAFAIGVLNEHASNRQQIANAKLMKTEIDRCLKLNPHHAGAYHLLGRWYRRLTELGSFERFAMKTFYGASLPKATYQDALTAFENAYVYEPSYILHQYELALTYHKMGRDADAKIWLQKAISANYAGDDAADTKAKCKKLLQEIE